MSQNVKDLIILSFKSLIYLILVYVFFVLLAIDNIGLINLSRTLAVTLLTYVLVLFLMTLIYGNFEIGTLKSKSIIYKTFLSILFTNLATYLMLIIMNTNSATNFKIILVSIDKLLLIMIIQFIVIFVGAYIGNGIYFKLNAPANTLIIFGTDYDADKIYHLLQRYKLQYRLLNPVSIYEPNLKKKIKKADYIVFLNVKQKERGPWVRYCYHHKIDFSYSPSLTEVIEKSGKSVVFSDKVMVDVRIEKMTIMQKIIKRLLDIVLSILFLVITSPVFLTIGVAIKIEDKGPVFFTQPRMTKNRKIFNVIKFRSMKVNVKNYSANQDDDRITKVGKVIRRLRVDELPQFINILCGDMSIVGPRPEMLSNIEKYEAELPEFKYRLDVKAGLTGLAQIEGKYNSTPEDKLLLDLTYISTYSLWNDIKLMFKTLIVFGKSDSTEGF